MRARVYRTLKNEFLCSLDESGQEVVATPLGKLLKTGIVIGDYVNLKEGASGAYEIHSVEERKNEIFRVLPRVSKKKITAANCDVLIITISATNPDYKRGIIDRFLLRAIQWQIHPVVVFNKMDLFNEDMFDLSFEQKRLIPLGVSCFEVSALDPSYKPRFMDKGFDDLKSYITGKTAIFLGQSGVGKSEMISSLSGGEIKLKSNQIGKGGKGAHTTTWSEIVKCGDFFFIDSPGIRSFSLDDFNPDELITYFPDIFDIASKCKYRDCLHLPESKGCAFSELDNSEESQMILTRVESYCRFHEESSANPHWEKKKY